jgi:hypothetical protein
MSTSEWLRRQDGVRDKVHDGLKADEGIAGKIHVFIQRVGWKFRKKRLEQFDQIFPENEFGELLDVGGTFAFWNANPRKVTIVNPAMPAGTVGNVTSIKGDGRTLPFPDKSFRLVFSNSAIEHMSKIDMQNFASELLRVGNAVYCQTPNRWFPYDCHYVAFLWHWWPALLHNYFLVRYLTGFGWVFRPTRKHVESWANEVHLLNEKEFRTLFPGCRIEKEKFLGMTKSFIAIRSEE